MGRVSDYVECRYCHVFLSTDMEEQDICDECKAWYRFFAGCALIGICNSNAGCFDPDEIAPMAWDMADAMIQERGE